MIRILLISLCLLSLAGAPARAAQDSNAAFEAELSRLAEILGALHYLRNVGGANEGQKWRQQMQALIDAEAQAAGIPEKREGWPRMSPPATQPWGGRLAFLVDDDCSLLRLLQN